VREPKEDASADEIGWLCLAASRLPRPKQLRPVEFRPVEFFLYALERGVADRAVGPERHETPPLGLGRGPHDCRVGVLSAGGRSRRRWSGSVLGRRAVRVRAVTGELVFRATQLEFVAVSGERGSLSAGARHRRPNRCPQRLDPSEPHLAINRAVVTEPQARQ
jgi:hypothetical protein